MKNKDKKYCDNRDCEHNILFSCSLYGNIPSYYVSSEETGDVQYGIGAQNNNLHNAIQAEGYVPVQQYTLEDNLKNNKLKK